MRQRIQVKNWQYCFGNGELNYFSVYRNISLIIGCLFRFYRAPQGCLQYFFENVNTITSFNYDGNVGRAGTEGGVLANQDYRICIKQNPGNLSESYQYYINFCTYSHSSIFCPYHIIYYIFRNVLCWIYWVSSGKWISCFWP